MFADLECDVVNPIELCNKLNPVNIPSHHSVCASWEYFACLSYSAVSTELSAGSHVGQYSSGNLSCTSLHERKAYFGCYRNISQTQCSQKGIFYQAWILFALLFLLSL